MQRSKLVFMVAVVLFVGCGPTVSDSPERVEATADNESEFIPLTERTVRTLEDGRKYIVHPEEIRDGGPPMDGIPSIDDPQFVSVKEADEWVGDDELVLALEHNGKTKAYPLQILVWHEIVNDDVGGEPIAVTYCPLCGSGIAYERILDGSAVEFGTSGKLYNSNLVMYDRRTETYWSQIDGVGIVGPRSGETLTPIPIDTVAWGEWKEEHSDASVLSRDTGYSRSYGEDPYGSYYEESNLFFPVDNRNDTIHPKDVVYGVTIGNVSKAYTKDAIEREDVIEDQVGDVALRIEQNDDGTVRFANAKTGEEVAKERDFWFAWYAFHPGTGLHR